MLLLTSVSHLSPFSRSFCLSYSSSSRVSVLNSKFGPSTMASTGQASCRDNTTQDQWKANAKCSTDNTLFHHAARSGHDGPSSLWPTSAGRQTNQSRSCPAPATYRPASIISACDRTLSQCRDSNNSYKGRVFMRDRHMMQSTAWSRRQPSPTHLAEAAVDALCHINIITRRAAAAIFALFCFNCDSLQSRSEVTLA
jgi:hypothetical protein